LQDIDFDAFTFYVDVSSVLLVGENYFWRICFKRVRIGDKLLFPSLLG
jgi:hypothetical protein